MVPDTPYAREMFMAYYGYTSRGYNPAAFGRNPQFDSVHPEFKQTTRSAPCDAQGRFRFNNVADGKFFVEARVVWQVNDFFYEGGTLMQLVEVAGGESKEIVLSPY